MFPPLQGKNILDLGCGYDWFCRYAQENHAASVVGQDISEKMLSRARSMTSVDGIVRLDDGAHLLNKLPPIRRWAKKKNAR